MGLLSAALMIINGAICFVFGLWFLLKNITKNLYFSFFIFSWLVAIWSMVRYAFYTSDTNIFLYREVYSLGGLALLAAGAMILFYLMEKPNKIFLGFLYLAGLFLVTVPFWDHAAITNLTYQNNILNYDVGYSYYLYFALVFFPLLYVFILLTRDIFTTKVKYLAY